MSAAYCATTSGFVWTLPPEIAAVPWLTTSQISTAQTSSNGCGSVCENLYAGDFSKLLIGLRNDISVYVTRDAKFDTDTVSFLVTARIAVQPTHKHAFTKVIDFVSV